MKWNELFLLHPITVAWYAVVIILWRAPMSTKPSGRCDADADIYGNVGIYIEFLGKAHCHWTEGSGTKKETYNGSEIYLDERQYILGNHNGECWPSL